MREYRVDISEEAEDDLDDIRAYLAAEGAADEAEQLIRALLAQSEALSSFPDRGSPRDDLGSGTRTFSYKRSTLIVYYVEESVVTVVGFIRRGRDVDAALRDRRR